MVRQVRKEKCILKNSRESWWLMVLKWGSQLMFGCAWTGNKTACSVMTLVACCFRTSQVKIGQQHVPMKTYRTVECPDLGTVALWCTPRSGPTAHGPAVVLAIKLNVTSASHFNVHSDLTLLSRSAHDSTKNLRSRHKVGTNKMFHATYQQAPDS